jgi:hypothetical protein
VDGRVRLTARDRAALHEVCAFATEALRFATGATGSGALAIQPKLIQLALGLEILERIVDSDDEITGDV